MKRFTLLLALLIIQPAHAWSWPWAARDTTPPTVPAGLTGSAASDRIDLKWQASTDKTGVKGYVIARDGAFLAITDKTAYSDAGLTPGKTYIYTVAAFDASRNTSRKSAVLKIATPSSGGGGGGSDNGIVIGYLGCSMTMNAAEGAIAQGGKFWNPVPTFSSGGVWRWAKDLDVTNAFWDEFQTAQNKQPAQIVWVELCALGKDAEFETYDNALKVIKEVKRRVPDATVYVSSQPSYLPADHECQIAGTGGQKRMAELAKQLVANKEALKGPDMGPLSFPDQTLTDGCHGNTAGNQAMGKQLLDFKWSDTNTPPTDPPPPPSSSTDQATGLYVVDDGDPDFSKALALSYVDGALVRVSWEQIEITDNQFDFKTLCSKITAAHNAGKKVSLVNYALAPPWLMKCVPSSEQWQSPLRNKMQPMPWNADAQAQLKAFAEAEANAQCDGYAIKSHPAVRQVDTPILGMQSIRQAPAYQLAQMTDAVVASIKIWHDAFGETGHIFYTGLFPLGTSTSDAISVRDAVQKLYPNQHWFQETLTGAGPSGKLAEPLIPGTMPFYTMQQACGYWSQQSRIKCGFANPDSPQIAYDKIGKALKTKYFEIYPDDLLFDEYKKSFEAIHAEIWQTH